MLLAQNTLIFFHPTPKQTNQEKSKWGSLWVFRSIFRIYNLDISSSSFFFPFPSESIVIFKHTSSSMLNIGPDLIWHRITCLWKTSPSEGSWELQVVPSLSRKLCLGRKSTSKRLVLFMITQDDKGPLWLSNRIPKMFRQVTPALCQEPPLNYNIYFEGHSNLFRRAGRTYQFLP